MYICIDKKELKKKNFFGLLYSSKFLFITYVMFLEITNLFSTLKKNYGLPFI